MTRRLIRADGTEQQLIGKVTNAEVRELINAKVLAIVALHHLGQPLQVMLVDDLAYETDLIDHGSGHFEMQVRTALKPINAEATRLYHANCVPGTKHQIAGDVVVTFDDDFA